MKKIIYLLMAIGASVGAASLQSCDDSDAQADRGKTPSVEYVRVCDPEAADSLLVRASMGQNICLMGSNLGDVREIWFNDQKALLNPTLITSFSIIVTVPNRIPDEVTNEITLVTGQGNRATFPFEVVVPNPLIQSVSCEYAKPGDIIEITGDFFIEPKVYFSGAQSEARIESFSQQSISVEVPAGVVEGPLTVESIYGRTRSGFNFLDTTGLITNFDDGYINPWGRGTITTDPDAISGNYLLMESPALSAWAWSDSMMWGYWAYADGASGNVPIAQGDISTLCLKFETEIETWQDVPMLFWFQKWSPGGNLSPDDAQYAQAHWKPWIKNGAKTDARTDGWVTVSIPLTEFKYNKEENLDNLSIGDISAYTDLNIMVFGAGDITAPMKVKMDNFRIVKTN